MGCPKPPKILIDPGPIATRVFFIILETIGFHGIFGFICGIIIVLGFIKLAFGNIIFCRKTKAKAFEDDLKKQGLVPKKGTIEMVILNLHVLLLLV